MVELTRNTFVGCIERGQSWVFGGSAKFKNCDVVSLVNFVEGDPSILRIMTDLFFSFVAFADGCLSKLFGRRIGGRAVHTQRSNSHGWFMTIYLLAIYYGLLIILREL